MSRRLFVVLGNQLFEPAELGSPENTVVFMAEDPGLCTEVRHHQQKLTLFLAAMRHYAEELADAGFEVRYHRLETAGEQSYEARLDAVLRECACSELAHFEIEDRPMETRLQAFARRPGLRHCILPSPMFLCSRLDFHDFARSAKRLHMADFYRWQRRSLGVLVNADGEPAGGRWSFDEENRRKLPADVEPPALTWAEASGHVTDVVALVKERFRDHPGSANDFAWPVTRSAARAWLQDFVRQRLAGFGPYEDALTTRSDALFHSVLSPVMNLGLLTPREVLDAALEAGDDVPLQSLEGFVRQVMGWREFIRGVYRVHGEEQAQANFWGHDRELTPAWFEGTTGIVPLDAAIQRTLRLGWTHHIERLMVIGNLMTLCEIKPASAWQWFMEMYVDSSAWVMGPNVFGMALYSDGGLFATKPYICASNYLRKMSDYPPGEWQDTVDGLYWRFVERHREFFASNPRLALMPAALDRLKADRRERIAAAADAFLDRYTIPGTAAAV
jgi:(6-4)DNA photolyase